MPVAIPNTTATTGYVQWGGSGLFDNGWIFVANGSVDVIYITGTTPGLQQEGGPFTLPPGLTPLLGGSKEAIVGIKVRAAGGTVATPNAQQYSGALFEPGVASIGAGSPFTGTVTASGAISPPVSPIDGITGRVSAGGAVLNGSGFTVTVLGGGDYQINYTTPFAALPIVVATSSNAAIFCYLQAEGLASCRIETYDPSALSRAAAPFDFIAIGVQ